MITNSIIAWGDQLGAQLVSLAQLYYLARENDKKLVFPDELKKFRRGYQFVDVFDLNDIYLKNNSGKLKNYIINKYCSQFVKKSNWKKKMDRMYNNKFMNKVDKVFYKYVMLSYKKFENCNKYKNDVFYEKELLNLEKNKAYDIKNGFGTFKAWGKYSDDICKMLRFKDYIVDEGQLIYNKLNIEKTSVSVHFRRTDYLVMSSLNLHDNYYNNAINQFKDEDVVFLVFSDDIDGCKNMQIFKDKDVIYMDTHSAGVDMYLMSLCDHNIIANSTFSFWGAFLNNNINKRVICPYNFIGSNDTTNSYINGNYYPDNWIAL
ncbi:MAG: alpha-1,2-fucosyltransferase [Lachnospiraceae bacterium]|nr:alpha-1,2-fucosyltransferase [Lachnospiraceae bacterium]